MLQAPVRDLFGRLCSDGSLGSKTMKILSLILMILVFPVVGSANSYTTKFPNNQNPLSEGGMWINGGTVGLDWTNMQSSPADAFGTMTVNGCGGSVCDSIASLTGAWGTNQTAVGVVHMVNNGPFLEVELHLHTTITAHSVTTYEFDMAEGYMLIVKWLGSRANFVELTSPNFGLALHDGDVMKATSSGTNPMTLTLYQNGNQIIQVTDTNSGGTGPFTGGSPGIGWFVNQQGGSTPPANLGFSSFTATDGAATCPASGTAGTYTTNFPLTENPISECGNWAGGQSAGGNLWGNVQTNGTMAFGGSEPTQFGDPTAILTGSWPSAQTATATVKLNTVPTGSCCHEAEVRLRMVISSSSITGYEVYCSVMPNNPYCHIARWNGPNGSYCNIEQSSPSTYLANGDVLSGTVSGTNPVVITGFKNGTQVMQATDTGVGCSTGGAAGPWTSGNPGIGFYDSQDNNWGFFGFSSFTVTGQTSGQKPTAPTGLNATVN
jgi:hypothetical protein